MSADQEIEAMTHEHVFLGDHHDENARRTLWVVVLTALMMVGEIIAGSIFNSMALLADGFHMATHAGALTVTAAAYAFAKRNARNRRFTFGTGKVGDLAGFASALVLALIALGLGVESVVRLLEPRPVAFTEATFVAVLGLFVNIASALLLSGGHHHGASHHHDHDEQHHIHDNNLRSAYLHVLADALTSVLAIAALLAGRYFGWIWLDPIMGIVGGIVIAVWSWNLLGTTAGVLLDTSDVALEKEVRQEVEGPGDARITDLHIWRIGPSAHAAIVSVTGPVDTATVRARLSPIHELAHITVEAQ
ncbi:CDF family Co(II)/Ni(II) efflux transporter DmeF [Nitrobacter sp. TKz-YC01]|uniref:CDF family Co(II)/Ni(II) efflux transporter DmeF n=1 Tax=Nitrobacter sp. TKz-YC01 TaxID=3398703 RepID=UPI003A0FF66A